MNIDELTIGQAREIMKMLGDNFSMSSTDTPMQPYVIDSAYLIRTVTHYDVGIVVAVGEHEIVLTDASWIADTGRFHDALTTGTLNEVEPFPDGRIIVGRGAIIDAAQWTHALPRTQK